MADQQALWDRSHREHSLDAYSRTATPFAREVEPQLPRHAQLLELGCGVGNDSLYFATCGHQVTATDFAPAAIKQNAAQHQHPRLKFVVQDISQPLAFPEATFDAVYARLSLHYFTTAQTETSFQDIGRVLKPSGQLFFLCKSVDNPLYGQGHEIEPDMFELDGHVRHFFSSSFARHLLQRAGFQEISLETGQEDFYARKSAFVKVAATIP